jgi:tetratricopeptide (TPR) repeat protein
MTTRALSISLCFLGLLVSSDPAFARHGGRSGGGGLGAMAAAWAAQRAAWLRREAIAEAIHRAKNNQQRMGYAATARKEGKMRLAATMYLRVALGRPKDKNNPAAKAALKDMAKQGRAEMKKGDELLAQNKIVEAFEKLDYLAWAYEEVPVANHEIAEHVAKLHRDPRYQSVLNEPPAADLIAEAQKQEQEGSRCCAYWTYEEAAKLTPAPSAIKAAERLEAMNHDPKLVAEAKECRIIQECQDTFHSAELMEKSLPEKSESLFKQILEKSPRDSEVYRDAKEELAKLHSAKRK